MDGPDDRQTLKRKRTPDLDNHMSASPAPPPKTAKTSNHLAINYLARQRLEDLPLISPDDPLQNILFLLTEYHGVLDRHESMAFNLGARPLGPILIKRFERLFDGPPKVLKCHAKEGTTITWLDVVEFYRNKPEQFTLGQMSEGVRVCQFYTKQCRVQISEEDYLVIISGMPQKLIPPQPVIDDEEKELGTLQILEGNLSDIYQLADQVAARGRQLRHRILARKQAILDRRATDSTFDARAASPSNIALINGNGSSSAPGFTAVNTKHVTDVNGQVIELSKTGATEATLHDLQRQFAEVRLLKKLSNGESGPQGQNTLSATIANAVRSISGAPGIRHESQLEHSPLTVAGSSTHPIFSTPTASNPKADDGPFKAEMIARMETVKRGDRILPPCDRCRRLHMDCIKNLTACQGCTKKHAKCSWKEVRLDEIAPPALEALPEGSPDFQRLRQNGTDKPNGSLFDMSGAPSALPRVTSLAMDAAAGLQAVAKASAAALESEEERRAELAHVQSPNLVHHSPNIPVYGEFAARPAEHASVNMPFASGRRPSGELHGLPAEEGEGREKEDGLEREALVGS